MAKPGVLWRPRFTITPRVATGLMAIEAARASLASAALPPAALAELRRKAQVRSTHYSTRIEGNRLTLAEAGEVLAARRVDFHGRKRDVQEVRHYWKALQRTEQWAEARLPITALQIRRLHALLESDTSSRPTAYRDGQNVIRDAATGAMVYLPPEAKEVPALMAALIAWLNEAERQEVPLPLVAHLAHYQFVTIHPFWDGNGRTARLLERWVLGRGGYGLAGLVGLEEGYASDPGRYYQALSTHPHHNYYEGRETADLTPWLDLAVGVAAEAFTASAAEARAWAERDPLPEHNRLLRKLDPRARRVLGLFREEELLTTQQIAQELALSPRMARLLVAGWVADGLLEPSNLSRRGRRYQLSAIYRQFIGIAEQGD